MRDKFKNPKLDFCIFAISYTLSAFSISNPGLPISPLSPFIPGSPSSPLGPSRPIGP